MARLPVIAVVVSRSQMGHRQLTLPLPSDLRPITTGTFAIVAIMYEALAVVGGEQRYICSQINVDTYEDTEQTPSWRLSVDRHVAEATFVMEMQAESLRVLMRL